MKIKICGLRRQEDIDAVNAARPDYIGFVFAPSKRRVDEGLALRLKERLSSGISAVGVFVDAPPERIASLCRNGIIDAIQLHGNEEVAYLERLREMVPQTPLMKAIRVQTPEQVLEAQKLPCHWLLLDAVPAEGYGGGGTPFDWRLIPPNIKPYFLAGGLTPETIPAAATLGPYCLDLSSGVETDGVKDPEKIMAAVQAARSV